jgi:hypothetical protein
VRLTREELNRTLLQRQGLLERRSGSVASVVRHLVGLQAQERLSPYVGLAARLEAFDPAQVTAGLESAALVRMGCLRGTIHLLTDDDALMIRSWTVPIQERERVVAQNLRAVRDLDLVAFRAAVSAALADGPLPVKALGEALTVAYPDHPPVALAGLARVSAPLAQLPPRGTWRGSGGVVYDRVDRWIGRPLAVADPAELVRRYLRAFGPATAADVTTWSGVPGVADVLGEMPDLVRHEDERGRALWDVPDCEIVSGDRPAPVRLLGIYDNLWLSHTARDRVTTPEARRRWTGTNGGLACTVFVDGWLAGLWRPDGDRVGSLELFDPLTSSQRSELDAEVARVDVLLGS